MALTITNEIIDYLYNITPNNSSNIFKEADDLCPFTHKIFPIFKQ